jgi:hypothetical protein
MTRRFPNPFFRTGRGGEGASRLALAIAAALAVSAPAGAREDMRYASAIRVRTWPGGEVSMQYETRPPAARMAAPHRQARAWTVTSCADDGGPGTLRSAVAAAGDGDTIDLGQLSCGRIELQLGMLQVDWQVDDLTIQGPGQDALTIDGGDLDGVLSFGGTGTLDVRDLSIARGRVVDLWGACICAPGGSVRLSRVRVSSCVAHQVTDLRGSVEGGAIFAFGNVALEDSQVLDSTASSELPGGFPDGSGSGVVVHPVVGGGIASLAGDVTLVRSRVSGNRAVATGQGGLGNVKGGGLYVFMGNVSIVDSVISDNHVATGFEDVGSYSSFALGGGLHAIQGALTVSGSTIAGNDVESPDLRWARGGGIAYFGAGAKIDGTTIEANRITGDSGGLHNQGGALTLVNSTISGNSATRGAGGLYDVNPSSLDHVTIAFNHSDAQAGGALLRQGGRVLNSIISRNTTDGAAPADLASGDAGISGGRNLIGDTGRSPLPLDTLRADPRLLPLADNGGPTKTHALDRTSPAIDGGAHAKNLPLDQRGLPRSSGSAPDIGAFEVQQVGIAPLGNGASGRDARAKPGSR